MSAGAIGFWFVPIRRGAGYRFDCGDERAVQFSHESSEVVDNLLPSLGATDRVLTAWHRAAANRQDHRTFESYAFDQTLHAEKRHDVVAPCADVEVEFRSQ